MEMGRENKNDQKRKSQEKKPRSCGNQSQWKKIKRDSLRTKKEEEKLRC